MNGLSEGGKLSGRGAGGGFDSFTMVIAKTNFVRGSSVVIMVLVVTTENGEQ